VRERVLADGAMAGGQAVSRVFDSVREAHPRRESLPAGPGAKTWLPTDEALDGSRRHWWQRFSRRQVTEDPGREAFGEMARKLAEHVASLEVSVDALDDRLSREVVEREAKLLEEMRRDLRSIETEISERFASAVAAMARDAARARRLNLLGQTLIAALLLLVLSRL
jgi:hypothetical protein